MPICILGMHRSGTSMITRLLNLCGLYLGPEADIADAVLEDNPEGYWENKQFTALNEEILSVFHGTWQDPPLMPAGWSASLEAIKHRASGLVTDFADHAVWGWKDPRTCLTLELWLSLLPDLKLLLCLRNPIEVAGSLGAGRTHRTLRFAEALRLWLDYHERILTVVNPERLVVTHYETYFYDPQAELRRVAGLLGIGITQTQIENATQTVKLNQRHYFAAATLPDNLPPAIAQHYKAFCARAGAVFTDLRHDSVYQLGMTQAAWRQTFAEAQSKTEDLALTQAELQALHATLEQMGLVLDVSRREISRRDASMLTQSTLIKAQEKTLADKEEALESRNRQIGVLEAGIRERELINNRQDMELANLRKQLQVLTQLNLELSLIRNFWLYRIMVVPFWTLEARLFPPGTQRHAAYLRLLKRARRFWGAAEQAGLSTAGDNRESPCVDHSPP